MQRFFPAGSSQRQPLALASGSALTPVVPPVLLSDAESPHSSPSSELSPRVVMA